MAKRLSLREWCLIAAVVGAFSGGLSAALNADHRGYHRGFDAGAANEEGRAAHESTCATTFRVPKNMEGQDVTLTCYPMGGTGS